VRRLARGVLLSSLTFRRNHSFPATWLVRAAIPKRVYLRITIQGAMRRHVGRARRTLLRGFRFEPPFSRLGCAWPDDPGVAF